MGAEIASHGQDFAPTDVSWRLEVANTRGIVSSEIEYMSRVILRILDHAVLLTSFECQNSTTLLRFFPKSCTTAIGLAHLFARDNASSFDPREFYRLRHANLPNYALSSGELQDATGDVEFNAQGGLSFEN